MIIPNITNMVDNADVLDAVICLLAAKNFLMGDAYYLQNMELAKKEGWIWVARATSNGKY